MIASRNCSRRTPSCGQRLPSWRQLVEQLQRRLGLDSSNSGKPPAQQRTRSQRGRTGKRPGGQPGHKGVTLRQTDTPDRIETHLPPSCADCGAPLAASDTEGEPLRRQVFDLKWPRFPWTAEIA